MTTRTPRSDQHAIVLAINILSADCENPTPDDPSAAQFYINFVTPQSKQVCMPCTAGIYQRVTGVYKPRKGHTGLAWLMRARFRLVVDNKDQAPVRNGESKPRVVGIDVVPEIEVLHQMRRKDLGNIQAIKIEIQPSGDFSIVHYPQGVRPEALIRLLQSMDRVSQFTAGDTFGRYTVLSAEGRFLEVEPPDLDDTDL